MKKFLLFLFISLICAGCSQSNKPIADAKTNGNGYKEFTVQNINFQWKIENKNISIKLSAPTAGWVAVGFDPKTGAVKKEKISELGLGDIVLVL